VIFVPSKTAIPASTIHPSPKGIPVTEFAPRSVLEIKPCISIQVVNEFITVVTKKIKKPIPFDLIKDHLDFIKESFIIYPLNIELAYKGLKIKSQYQFSYYDSLIIASAYENNCNILYSEDMQHAQVINGKLTIINPFKVI
jgi:predicted nucleic acid-binding protein